MQLSLFRVWKADFLPQISEILGSVICSSYIEHGGLNCVAAGSAPAHALARYTEALKINATKVFSELRHLQNSLHLDFRKQRRRNAMALYLDQTRITALQVENSQLRTKWNEIEAGNVKLEAAITAEREDARKKKAIEQTRFKASRQKTVLDQEILNSYEQLVITQDLTVDVMKYAHTQFSHIIKQEELEEFDSLTAIHGACKLERLKVIAAESKAERDINISQNFDINEVFSDNERYSALAEELKGNTIGLYDARDEEFDELLFDGLA